MILQNIYIYPIKSLGGLQLQEAVLGEKGIQFDRRWMLVDKNGNFLTQRKHYQMALYKVKLAENGLFVFHSEKPGVSLEIPFLPKTNESVEVSIWEDTVTATIVDPKVSDWFSEHIGIPCNLVYMPDSTERKIKPKYAVNDESVSFADAMPYLIIGQTSLDDLNERLEDPVPMDRFRPNFVFSGGKPYEEDNWDTVNIGDSEFKITKPCARCVMTTVDQQTGEKGKEPLKTLSKYRSMDNKVMFGQNMLLLKGKRVAVGDKVEGKI